MVTPMPALPLPPPRKTMSGHTRHRPLRPSNLGQPPISPALLSSEVPSESSASASRASVSAFSGDDQNTSGCPGSDTTAGRPPLKIVIPAMSKRLPGAVASSCGLTTTTTTATTMNEANTNSMAQTSVLETANEGEGHAHGYLFGSVGSVVGGDQGLEVWTRCPSGPSVGDDTDGGHASGSIELTSNAGSIAGRGSTSTNIPNERARTVRAGAEGEGEGENNGDGLPLEPTGLTGAHVRGTGAASSSCGDRLDVINAAVDDARDNEHPASGSIDTRKRDPEPGPGRLRRRKRKLDECES